MNLKHAQYMYEIYKNQGNISKAAKKLFISQPALSQTIKLVEAEIGIKIFDRSKNPVTLTYPGELYIRTIEKMILLETNFQIELNELKQEHLGQLRIGIPTQRAIPLLPKLLPVYRESYPSVKIDIIEAGSAVILDLAANQEVDLAFVVAPKDMSAELKAINLCTEQLLLFAGPGTSIAKTKPPFSTIQIDEIKDENFVSLRIGHGVRSIQDQIFFDYKISPNILFEVENIELARHLSNSCNGVTFYPNTLLFPHICHNPNHLNLRPPTVFEGDFLNLRPPTVFEGDFLYYFLNAAQYERDYYICYNKNRYLTAYMKYFIDLVKSAYTKGE